MIDEEEGNEDDVTRLLLDDQRAGDMVDWSLLASRFHDQSTESKISLGAPLFQGRVTEFYNNDS